MERHPSISGALKEGFLLKKSVAKHRWKTRWFVLFEDRLNYYRRRDLSCTVGSIILNGAALVFPVPGYEKKQAVFRISTREGKDYLLKAPAGGDRDIWTHAVGAVIRSMDSSVQPENEAPLPVSGRVNLSDLLGAMQDPDAGVQLQTCQMEDTQYDHCFSGSTAVDWLLKWAFAKTREQGCQLACELLRLAHIQPLQAKKPVMPSTSNKEKFVDSSTVIYRFSALDRSGSHDQEMLFESSSESSNSSPGEASEGDFLSNNRPKNKGKIIKEGFLSKREVLQAQCLRKGYLRKKWKVRKVVLKDSPPCLEYYSATQELEEPLKVMEINNALVLDVNDQTQDDELLTTLPKKRKHVFCVKREDGRPLVFQADDEHQKVEWIRAVQKVCH